MNADLIGCSPSLGGSCESPEQLESSSLEAYGMEPSPSTSADSVAKQLLTTRGRSSRGFFWATLGGFYLVAAMLGFVGRQLPESGKLVVGALVLPLLFALIVVQTRRWHDRDKSAWWILVNFLPCVGVLWVLIECGALPGTEGPNRYGADPTRQSGA